MERGKTLFRCPKCGKVFIAPDFEENATTLSVPMACPRCGTKSYRLGDPRGLVESLRTLFGKISRKQ